MRPLSPRNAAITGQILGLLDATAPLPISTAAVLDGAGPARLQRHCAAAAEPAGPARRGGEVPAVRTPRVLLLAADRGSIATRGSEPGPPVVGPAAPPHRPAHRRPVDPRDRPHLRRAADSHLRGHLRGDRPQAARAGGGHGSRGTVGGRPGSGPGPRSPRGAQAADQENKSAPGENHPAAGSPRGQCARTGPWPPP